MGVGGGLAGIPYGDTDIPNQNTLVRVHGMGTWYCFGMVQGVGGYRMRVVGEINITTEVFGKVGLREMGGTYESFPVKLNRCF